VRGIRQFGGRIRVHARQADIEPRAQEIIVARFVQIHLRIDGEIGRESDFHIARHKAHRAFETGGPAGCEELFGIGAAACAGTRELHVQMTVGAVSGAVIAAAGRVGFRGVDDFIGLGHGGSL
jgi:hypothetical protein